MVLIKLLFIAHRWQEHSNTVYTLTPTQDGNYCCDAYDDYFDKSGGGASDDRCCSGGGSLTDDGFLDVDCLLGVELNDRFNHACDLPLPSDCNY